jgi:hypothetical protein
MRLRDEQPGRGAGRRPGHPPAAMMKIDPSNAEA